MTREYYIVENVGQAQAVLTKLNGEKKTITRQGFTIPSPFGDHRYSIVKGRDALYFYLTGGHNVLEADDGVLIPLRNVDEVGPIEEKDFYLAWKAERSLFFGDSFEEVYSGEERPTEYE